MSSETFGFHNRMKFVFTIVVNILTIPIEGLFYNFFDLTFGEVGIYVLWIRVITIFNALFNTTKKNIFSEE
jgi:hypothetical protein